jgi:guanylate kinase
MHKPECQVSAEAVAAFSPVQAYLDPAPLLVVISGPSGVGKDSVVEGLRQSDHEFEFVVTATDRPPRPGEVDGVDYHFVSTAEFERMIAENELIEYARVYDQHKGVPKRQALKALNSGVDVLMRLDVQGAATIRQRVPGAITIFLTTSSAEELFSRLSRRATDSAEQIQQRFDTAVAEMARMPEFDYVVINHEGRLDEAVDTVEAILTAEKCRTGREPIVL